MSSSECSWRRACKVAVAAICSANGFGSAQDAVLETLTEMLQSYLFEAGRSARAFTELAGRTDPMLSDVSMALRDMGTDVDALPQYARSSARPPPITPPAPGSAPANPKTLPVGERMGHTPHIPAYLPPFPDPHTYIRTLTQREAEGEYATLRERAATQKRDVERALTRYIAKTGDTESLFPDDPYAFPLIANKPKQLAYLDALLPKEQEGEGHPEGHDPAAATLNRLKGQTPGAPPLGEGQQQHPSPAPGQKPPNAQGESTPPKPGAEGAVGAQQGQGGGVGGGEGTSGGGDIDNPYLRAIIMPKLNIKAGAKKPLAHTASAYKW